MSEGHDHNVTRCVWVRIQHDIAMVRAMDNVRLSVISSVGQFKEDAAGVLFRSCHIGIAQWRPEVIHRTAGYQIAAVFGNSRDLSAMKKISAARADSCLTLFRNRCYSRRVHLWTRVRFNSPAAGIVEFVRQDGLNITIDARQQSAEQQPASEMPQR